MATTPGGYRKSEEKPVAMSETQAAEAVLIDAAMLLAAPAATAMGATAIAGAAEPVLPWQP